MYAHCFFPCPFAWLTLSLALAVACRDVDVRNVKALIIGPHETPYEFGFFEVGMSTTLCSVANDANTTQFTFKFNKGWYAWEEGPRLPYPNIRLQITPESRQA